MRSLLLSLWRTRQARSQITQSDKKLLRDVRSALAHNAQLHERLEEFLFTREHYAGTLMM